MAHRPHGDQNIKKEKKKHTTWLTKNEERGELSYQRRLQQKLVCDVLCHLNTQMKCAHLNASLTLTRGFLIGGFGGATFFLGRSIPKSSYSRSDMPDSSSESAPRKVGERVRDRGLE